MTAADGREVDPGCAAPSRCRSGSAATIARCPQHDRREGVAQWLYRAVIARQERVPADDLTPWDQLAKDQRNGWRAWADELLVLIQGASS